ncbi:hypothetical protein C0J52_26817, partial [Blattella germanica]
IPRSRKIINLALSLDGSTNKPQQRAQSGERSADGNIKLVMTRKCLPHKMGLRKSPTKPYRICIQKCHRDIFSSPHDTPET